MSTDNLETAIYTVEIVTAISETGEKTWETAARWPLPGETRQMDYGAAERLAWVDALNTFSALVRIGSEVRLVRI